MRLAKGTICADCFSDGGELRDHSSPFLYDIQELLFSESCQWFAPNAKGSYTLVGAMSQSVGLDGFRMRIGSSRNDRMAGFSKCFQRTVPGLHPHLYQISGRNNREFQWVDINDAFVRDTNFSLPGLTGGRHFETNNNNNDRQPGTESFSKLALWASLMESTLMLENSNFRPPLTLWSFGPLSAPPSRLDGSFTQQPTRSQKPCGTSRLSLPPVVATTTRQGKGASIISISQIEKGSL